MYQSYTREHLKSLTRAQLWEICDSQNLFRRRSAADCVEEILTAQPQKVAEAEITQPATVTCATCPLARWIDGDRYCCQAQHNHHSQVTRGHWEATKDCEEAIADSAEPILQAGTWQHEAEVGLVDFLLTAPVATEEPIKPIRTRQELEEQLNSAIALKVIELIDNAKYDLSDIDSVELKGGYVCVKSWLQDEPILINELSFANRINQYLGIEPVTRRKFIEGDRPPLEMLSDSELWAALIGVRAEHAQQCRGWKSANAHYQKWAKRRSERLSAEEDDRGSGRVLVEA